MTIDERETARTQARSTHWHIFFSVLPMALGADATEDLASLDN